MLVAASRLSESASTFNLSQAAAKFIKAYRNNIMKRPEEVAYCEIEVDPSAYFMEMATDLISSLIPINHDSDFSSPSEDQTRVLTPITMAGYMGQHLKHLRKIFPNHPDWIDLEWNEYPAWWTAIRGNFISRATNYQMVNAPDGVYSTKTSPLYADLRKYGGKIKDSMGGKVPLWDLRHAFIWLITQAAPNNDYVEKFAYIGNTYDAVGRGGEVKFMKILKWVYDARLRVLNTPWVQSKTTTISAMPRAPNDDPYFDFFFQYGSFALCNKGLSRSAQQVRDGLQHVAYPSLHNIKHTSVTTKITNVLRMVKGSIFPRMSKEEINLTSAKSMRQAGITEMVLCSDLSVFDVCAISGHALPQNTLPSYVDFMNPQHGIAARNLLNGRKDIGAEIIQPSLMLITEGMADGDAFIDALLEEMYHTNIPEFMPDGHLRPVLELMAASVIRHQNQLIKDCKVTNQITSAMVDVIDELRKKGLLPANFSATSNLNALLHFSTVIEDKYTEDVKSTQIKRMGGPGSPSAELYNKISDMDANIKTLIEDRHRLLMEVTNSRGVLSEMEQHVRRLEQELQAARSQLARTNHKLTAFGTPSPSKRQREDEYQYPSFNGATDDAAMQSTGAASTGTGLIPPPPPPPPPPTTQTTTTSTTYAAATSTTAAPIPPPPPPPPPPATANVTNLHFPPRPPRIQNITQPVRIITNVLGESNRSRIINEGSGDAGVKLSKLFETMSTDGGIVEEAFGSSSFRNNGKNQALYKYCLELAQRVGQPNHFEVLANRERRYSTMAVFAAASDLEQACVDKLFEFEGTTEAEDKLKRKPKQRNVTGMGKRIRTYKKRIKDARRLPGSGCDGVHLMELAALEQLEAENNMVVG